MLQDCAATPGVWKKGRGLAQTQENAFAKVEKN